MVDSIQKQAQAEFVTSTLPALLLKFGNDKAAAMVWIQKRQPYAALDSIREVCRTN